MRQLLPGTGGTSVAEALADFDPVALAGDERPYVFSNFAVTVDGRASIEGRSGAIGSDTDTEMLMGLRSVADGVLVGAGTVRAEQYGRLLPSAERRARRERRGLPHDPLAVIVSESMDVPWEAGLFSSGAGRVVVVTASDDDPPETATPVRVLRQPDGIDLTAALQWLRRERGIRGLLCEGGPATHGRLLAEGLVDELFVTVGPLLAGGDGPRLVEGLDGGPQDLRLRWLLESDGELFARYAVAGSG